MAPQLTGCAVGQRPVKPTAGPVGWPPSKVPLLASVLELPVPTLNTYNDRPNPSYRLKLLPFRAQAINDDGLVCGAITVSKRDPRTRKFYYENGHLALWAHGSLRDLGNLAGNNWCLVNTVNSQGDILGVMGEDPPGAIRETFLWTGGHLRQLPIGDADATAMNDRKQIVGRKEWVYVDGRIDEIRNPFGLNISQINDINNKGQMIGFAISPDTITTPYGPASGKVHLLLYRSGAAAEIPLPEGYELDGQHSPKMNNSGQVIINAFVTDRGGSHDHCFLWHNGKLADLGKLPGLSDMNGIAISSRGDIIGNAVLTSSNYKSRPFLWRRGTLYSLNDLAAHPGWTMTAVTGINRRGQIVGQGDDKGTEYNFLLTPVTK